MEMTKEILLTQGKVALVDDGDFELANQYKWYAFRHTIKGKTTGWYAARTIRNIPHETQFLHQLIMQPPKGMIVDHKDGNGLNCTSDNMRLCSHLQNMANKKLASNNKSGYKGVSWSKDSQKWFVGIGHGSTFHFVGRFDDLEEAAHAYDKAARDAFGEFARTNFQDG